MLSNTIRTKARSGIGLGVRLGPEDRTGPQERSNADVSQKPLPSAAARAEELNRFRRGVLLGASLIAATLIGLYLAGVY